MVDERGMYGLLPGRGDGHTRLLVTDDGPTTYCRRWCPTPARG